jgi:hypothetical protein
LKRLAEGGTELGIPIVDDAPEVLHHPCASRRRIDARLLEDRPHRGGLRRDAEAPELAGDPNALEANPMIEFSTPPGQARLPATGS